MIRFDKVTKDYGDGKGVFDVDLELTGGIAGFLGENGAGKTTVMNLLFGLLRPDSGTVSVFGRDVWRDREFRGLKAKMGFLPGTDYLPDRLTGRESLEYVSFLKTGDRFAYRVLKDVIEDFKLTEAMDDLVKTYSAGMKRKLHFLAALVNLPDVLVLDEPHNGMDVLTINRMKTFLKDYARDGKLVFFSSHIIEMIEKLCDEVVIIHKGRIADRFTSADKKFKNLEEHFLSVVK